MKSFGIEVLLQYIYLAHYFLLEAAMHSDIAFGTDSRDIVHGFLPGH